MVLMLEYKLVSLFLVDQMAKNDFQKNYKQSWPFLDPGNLARAQKMFLFLERKSFVIHSKLINFY